jgi:hypothetical protein
MTTAAEPRPTTMRPAWPQIVKAAIGAPTPAEMLGVGLERVDR